MEWLRCWLWNPTGTPCIGFVIQCRPVQKLNNQLSLGLNTLTCQGRPNGVSSHWDWGRKETFDLKSPHVSFLLRLHTLDTRVHVCWCWQNWVFSVFWLATHCHKSDLHLIRLCPYLFLTWTCTVRLDCRLWHSGSKGGDFCCCSFYRDRAWNPKKIGSCGSARQSNRKRINDDAKT